MGNLMPGQLPSGQPQGQDLTGTLRSLLGMPHGHVTPIPPLSQQTQGHLTTQSHAQVYLPQSHAQSILTPLTLMPLMGQTHHTPMIQQPQSHLTHQPQTQQTKTHQTKQTLQKTPPHHIQQHPQQNLRQPNANRGRGKPHSLQARPHFQQQKQPQKRHQQHSHQQQTQQPAQQPQNSQQALNQAVLLAMAQQLLVAAQTPVLPEQPILQSNPAPHGAVRQNTGFGNHGSHQNTIGTRGRLGFKPSATRGGGNASGMRGGRGVRGRSENNTARPSEGHPQLPNSVRGGIARGGGPRPDSKHRQNRDNGPNVAKVLRKSRPPTYECKIGAHTVSKELLDHLEVRHRYPKLHLLKTFSTVEYRWVEQFPIPTHFHGISEEPDFSLLLSHPFLDHTVNIECGNEFQLVVEELPEEIATPAPDGVCYSVRVMMCTGLPHSGDRKHLSKQLKFLFLRENSQLTCIGGPYNQLLDGGDWQPAYGSEDSDYDPELGFKRAAIRHCLDQTDLDLSGVSQWWRFIDICYHRKIEPDLDTPISLDPQTFRSPNSALCCTLIYVISLWDIVPSLDDYLASWQARELIRLERKKKANEPAETESQEAATEKPKTAQEDSIPGQRMKIKDEPKPQESTPPAISLDAAPKEPAIFVVPKRSKSKNKKCGLIPLDGLLDYNVENTEEGRFEISLFAESFSDILQRDFGTAIFRRVLDGYYEKKFQQQEERRKEEEEEKSLHEEKEAAGYTSVEQPMDMSPDPTDIVIPKIEESDVEVKSENVEEIMDNTYKKRKREECDESGAAIPAKKHKADGKQLLETELEVILHLWLSLIIISSQRPMSKQKGS